MLVHWCHMKHILFDIWFRGKADQQTPYVWWIIMILSQTGPILNNINSAHKYQIMTQYNNVWRFQMYHSDRPKTLAEMIGWPHYRASGHWLSYMVSGQIYTRLWGCCGQMWSVTSSKTGA